MTKKFVNFRPIVMFFVAIIVGVLCGYCAMKGHLWVPCCVASLLILAGILFLILKKFYVGIFIFVALATFLVGFFNFNITYKKFCADIYYDEPCKVSGKITDFYSEYSDYIFIIIKNPTVLFDNNVKVYDDKNIGVWVYFDEDDDKDLFKNRAGSFVDFTCELNTAPIFVDGINTFYVKNNVAFVASNVKDVQITQGRASFDEVTRQYIKTVLKQNLTEETSPIAIALLLGDKSAISQELQNGYRTMGISHVFAVSGLHVGFIYTLIGFFIFKFRVLKWKAIPITFFPMLFYAWICGFSASVVRALIMASCSLILQGIGAKNDGLTSMSIAGSILLCICPLYLFDAGFLLSFSAVVGINCISKVIMARLYTENKILKFLADTLAISLGASIGVMPVVAHFYGEITLWGFLTNIIITPLISIVFVLLLVGLIPFMKFVLILPKYFILATNFLAKKIVALSFGSFETQSFGIAILLLFLAMFVFGGYFNLSKKLKVVTISVLVGLFFVVGFFVVMPKNTQVAVGCFEGNDLYNYVVTDDDNNAYVVTDLQRENETIKILNYCIDNNVKSLYFFVLDYSKVNTDNIKIFSDYAIKVNSLYVVGDYVDATKDAFLIDNNILKFNLAGGHSAQIGDFSFDAIMDGNARAWYLKSNSADMLFCNDMSKNAFDYIYRNFINGIDLIFVSHNEDYVVDYDERYVVVTNNYFKHSRAISLKVYGNLTIKFDNDNIIIVP